MLFIWRRVIHVCHGTQNVWAVLVAAYALSPIDLIPDFIPVIGYHDDLVLLPLGVLLVIRLVPPGIMAEHRATADKHDRLSRNRVAAALIIILWVCGSFLLAWHVFVI